MVSTRELADYVTLQDLREMLKPFPTKSDLRDYLTEKLKPFATKEYLDKCLAERLKPFVTREYLKEELERSLNAFRAEIYRALLFQGLGNAALVVALIKLIG